MTRSKIPSTPSPEHFANTLTTPKQLTFYQRYQTPGSSPYVPSRLLQPTSNVQNQAPAPRLQNTVQIRLLVPGICLVGAESAAVFVVLDRHLHAGYGFWRMRRGDKQHRDGSMR